MSTVHFEVCEAAAAGKLELLQRLVRSSQEPSRLLSSVDDNGNTVLHYAAAVVLYLLQEGAPINYQNSQGDTAAHVAVGKNLDGMVLWLMKKGADLRVRNKLEQTVQQLASPTCLKYINEYFALQQRVKNDITRSRAVQFLPMEQREEILKGASDGDLNPIMKYFKLIGPEVLSTTDIDGKSLLHIACENNQPRIVAYLLQGGVDPNREEEYGNTALIMTSADGHEELVELLIQAKAQLDKKSLFNHTALMLSALQGHEGVVKQLIAAGASVNLRGKKGYTALHYAAEYAQAGVISLLMEAKADLTIQNNEHKTAPELAIPILADLMLGEVNSGAPPVQSMRVMHSLIAEFPDLTIEQNDLHLSSCVGKGAFADVYKASWKGKVVAVKQLRHKGSYAINIFQRLANEIRILLKLQHSGILKLHGLALNGQQVSIVCNFLPRGSLADVIYRDKQQLSHPLIVRVALQVARALKWIHEQGVIHRDIRSANVLVDNDFNPCIADFGLSLHVSSRSEYAKEGDDGIGALRWMAPEAYVRRLLTLAMDVYSYALLLWELLACTVPFPDISPVQAAQLASTHDTRPVIPVSTPQALADLIEQCWKPIPTERPTFEEICNKLQVEEAQP